MATGGRQGPGQAAPEPSGATEPITLTDPDGAVTRVAPWSSWTREQVRAPGGEPALVTRLDLGQLWFAAGRKRSPWRHEVHVGPAVVSTPRGRFQAVAEPDGGATISCLAGRTRVVAGLRDPVVLGPDQSAAISSDGRTLVVMDRASGTPVGVHEDPEAPIVASPPPPPPPVVDEPTVVAVPGEIDLRDPVVAAPAAIEPAPEVEADVDPEPLGELAPPVAPDAHGADDLPVPLPDDEPAQLRPDRSRFGWLPEVAAVAALVGLLVAAVLVFGRSEPTDEVVTAPVTTELPVDTTDPRPTTTEPQPTSTTEPDTTSTTAPAETTQPTTPPEPPAASGAFGVGTLTSCRRADGGIGATVSVEHRSGSASRFKVSVAVNDPSGVLVSQADATSDITSAGGTTVVQVLVPTAPDAQGTCEVLDVTGVR